MRHTSLDQFITTHSRLLTKGPIAVIMAEDAVEVESTIQHHLTAGCAQILLLAPAALPIALDSLGDDHPQLQRIDHDVHQDDALVHAVNQIIPQASGQWVYYGYNAEYLFHPFCESRNLRELCAFQTEERRDAFVSYVVDLYAGDLHRTPSAVSRDEAMLDRAGYYALARPDPLMHGHPRDRQLDFYGGLRWRFEEHIPPARRRIDRIALFRAQPGLVLGPDFTFNLQEYNTYACPWHNNISTAVVSFRTAKALRANPGSRHRIDSFQWYNSVPFAWKSQQLMELGLMEPGQWF